MKQIRDWEYKLDRIIFNEQMAAGSYQNGLNIPVSVLSKMKIIQEKGQIAPYYGAIGAGACYYMIQVIFPRCHITVNHSVLNEKLTIIDRVKVIQYDADTDNNDHSNSSANWFRVEAEEYRILTEWNYWNQKKEFTGRYIYHFSPNSLGVGKTVIDTVSGNDVDLVNYSKW